MKLNSSVLYTKCQPATFDRPLDNLRLAQSLFQLMIKERGIGLAANQAGHNIRLFVMYVDREAFHCFNPEVISVDSDIIAIDEGCLSFPGERIRIFRPASIRVQYSSARGQSQERDFTGIAARCFLHELDHLDGITMHQRRETVNV